MEPGRLVRARPALASENLRPLGISSVVRRNREPAPIKARILGPVGQAERLINGGLAYAKPISGAVPLPLLDRS